MADQFNDSIPAVTNQITEDVADISESLGWLKDCFQHINNGFANDSLAALGFTTTIWAPANAMTPTTTNGAAPGIYEYATNDNMRSYFAFDGATEEFVCFDLPMPEGWNRSTVKAKFYWSSATGSTAGDTCEWEIAGISVSNDDALDVALGTGVVVSDTLLSNNGADLQVTAATGAITIGGSPALGDMVQFKVSRNVGGTDNMTEDAWLFGVLIQIAETFPDASGTNAVAAW